MNDRPRAAARALLCLLLCVLSGCVYFVRRTLPGACANDLGSPMHNFCVVTPGVLWRGASPGRADAAWLVEHGVRTVVSLQLNMRPAFRGARLDSSLAHSVIYYRVQDFIAVDVLTHYHLDEHVAYVLAIIEKAPKPVFVSCRAGVDRTGIIAAAYRVLVQGKSRGEAIAEMDRFHSPWDPLNGRYVRSLSGARATKILRAMKKWESRMRPTGEFVCRDGRCRFHAFQHPTQRLNTLPRASK
ncbi:MAG: fused DSP-PTPase phosphatase/NAD kinase-like protein [Steroidobacteraceae bacterium]